MIFCREVIVQFHCELLLSSESEKGRGYRRRAGQTENQWVYSNLIQGNLKEGFFVLAARLEGTHFGRQIFLLMHKKVDKENLPAAKVDYF